LRLYVDLPAAPVVDVLAALAGAVQNFNIELDYTFASDNVVTLDIRLIYPIPYSPKTSPYYAGEPEDFWEVVGVPATIPHFYHVALISDALAYALSTLARRFDGSWSLDVGPWTVDGPGWRGSAPSYIPEKDPAFLAPARSVKVGRRLVPARRDKLVRYLRRRADEFTGDDVDALLVAARLGLGAGAESRARKLIDAYGVSGAARRLADEIEARITSPWSLIELRLRPADPGGFPLALARRLASRPTLPAPVKDAIDSALSISP